MKRILANALFFWLVLVISQNAEAQTGNEIIKKVNDLMNQESLFSKSKMLIQTSSGQVRKFEYDSWGRDHNEKTLIRYTSPRRAKGQAILMRNNADDIWMFFPRTNRVRKMATHAKRQKMEGSDFSYEDMGSGDSFIVDFRTTLLGSENVGDESCYKLELKRKSGSSSAYRKILIWSSKRDFHPLKMEYFENEETHPTKLLTLSEIKIIQGVPTAKKMVMQDLLDGTQTELLLQEIKYGVTLEEKMFTERGLRQ